MHKAYPTRYEIYDDLGELEATIEMFDAECSEIDLRGRVHCLSLSKTFLLKS